MIFNGLKNAVRAHFDTMRQSVLLRTTVTGDEMWETYLA